MGHALILRNDHRIARIVITEIRFQHMGMHFLDEAFHALAEFALRIGVVPFQDGFQRLDAAGDTLDAVFQRGAQLLVLGDLEHLLGRVERLTIGAVHVLQLVDIDVFKGIKGHAVSPGWYDRTARHDRMRSVTGLSNSICCAAEGAPASSHCDDRLIGWLPRHFAGERPARRRDDRSVVSLSHGLAQAHRAFRCPIGVERDDARLPEHDHGGA